MSRSLTTTNTYDSESDFDDSSSAEEQSKKKTDNCDLTATRDSDSNDSDDTDDHTTAKTDNLTSKSNDVVNRNDDDNVDSPVEDVNVAVSLRGSSLSKSSLKSASSIKERRSLRSPNGDVDDGLGGKRGDRDYASQSEGEAEDDNDDGDKEHPPPEVLLQRAHRRIRRLLRKVASSSSSSYKDKDAVPNQPFNVSVLDDFIRCVPLARIIFGDFHWRLARAYADLALAYLDLLQLPVQSHEHASKAKTLLTQTVHLSDDSLEKVGILETFLIAYYAHGRSCARLDKDVEAEKALLKAEKIHAEFGKLAAVDAVVVAEWEIKIVLAVARLYAKKKSYVAAEEEFSKCLRLLETFHESPSDLALVPVLLDLARMKLSVGTTSQIQASIELFHRAHDINVDKADDKADIEGSLTSARSALALGQAYATLDKDESHLSAEAYVRKATEAFQSALGSGHEETQAALASLAKLLVRMTKTSEAVDVLKSKIRGRFEVEGGEFSEVMASDHNLIANIFLAGGDIQRAAAHLKKCVDIRKVVLGPNHRKTRETLAAISSISH